MRGLLRTHKPDKALELTLDSLFADIRRGFSDDCREERGGLTPREYWGLAWLFISYRHIIGAREIVRHLKAHTGLTPPPRLVVRLLAQHVMSEQMRTAGDHETFRALASALVESQDAAVLAQTGRRESLDPVLVRLALEAAKRLVQPDAFNAIWTAYRASLAPHERPGVPRLWRTAIVAKGIGEQDIGAARQLFLTWRDEWRVQANTVSPPDDPYLGLMYTYTSWASRDESAREAYALARLMHRDGVTFSIEPLNMLLELEAARERYASFWALWRAAFLARGDAAPLAAPNRFSWRIATRVLKRRYSPRFITRSAAVRRLQSETTPLSRLAHLPLAQGQTRSDVTHEREPTFRALLAHVLAQHAHEALAAHGGLDAIRPSTHKHVLTTKILNRFLALAVTRGSFVDASVVLDVYALVGAEPDGATHESVVHNIVARWQEGFLDDAALDEARGINRNGVGDESDPAFRRKLRAKLQLAQNIIARREVRVALWTDGKDELSEGADFRTRFLAAGPSATAPEGALTTEVRESLMAQELGDCRYLYELLQRCETGETDTDEARKRWLSAREEAKQDIVNLLSLVPDKSTAEVEAERPPLRLFDAFKQHL